MESGRSLSRRFPIDVEPTGEVLDFPTPSVGMIARTRGQICVNLE